jgi:hypothetical protein
LRRVPMGTLSILDCQEVLLDSLVAFRIKWLGIGCFLVTSLFVTGENIVAAGLNFLERDNASLPVHPLILLPSDHWNRLVNGLACQLVCVLWDNSILGIIPELLLVYATLFVYDLLHLDEALTHGSFWHKWVIFLFNFFRLSEWLILDFFFFLWRLSGWIIYLTRRRLFLWGQFLLEFTPHQVL